MDERELNEAAKRKFLSEEETTRLLFKYRREQQKVSLLTGIIVGFLIGGLAVALTTLYFIDYR